MKWATERLLVGRSVSDAAIRPAARPTDVSVTHKDVCGVKCLPFSIWLCALFSKSWNQRACVRGRVQESGIYRHCRASKDTCRPLSVNFQHCHFLGICVRPCTAYNPRKLSRLPSLTSLLSSCAGWLETDRSGRRQICRLSVFTPPRTC